jgi:threonine dehydrogenase-like Zn-dependent dehydrogenase
LDALIDTSGNVELVTQLSANLRKGGQVASCANGADGDSLLGCDLVVANTMTAVTTPHLATLAQLVERGAFGAPRIRTLPLDQAADALAAALTRHTSRKLILSPHD